MSLWDVAFILILYSFQRGQINALRIKLDAEASLNKDRLDEIAKGLKDIKGKLQ